MYTQEQMGQSVISSTTSASLTPGQLSAAAGVYAKWLVTKPLTLKRAYVIITTNTTCESASAVIAVKKNLQYAVTTAQVTVCTLTIPTAATIGQVYANAFAPVNYYAGQEISFDLKTSGTSTATAAGAYFVAFDYELQPEVPTNETAGSVNTTTSSVTVVTA